MPDVIRLLPDSVANQIAAGEVIQRPASVVKELMENSVDAGAGEIQVIIKDAGRTLIQVIDDGTGMSETDARLAFERHSTSKIKSAGDLFSITTKGFRGEALASIAAVAMVELRTRRKEDETGTLVVISGSKVEKQEVCTCRTGSNFAVKSLFFNVPARRKFLKSDNTELRHIINEFQKIALAHPAIKFSLHHNDSEIHSLPQGNLKQRITAIFGKNMSQDLLNVETSTTIVNISGYICKPEAAKKSAGEQFFFANDRFIRHPYLHKAVLEGFQKILPPDVIPSYFIYLNVDPSKIDVNIHPTKTEVKFEDERAIWQILNASVRESLGRFNIIPALDFGSDSYFDIPVKPDGLIPAPPQIKTDPSFNPFKDETRAPRRELIERFEKEKLTNWEKLYQDSPEPEAQGQDKKEDAATPGRRLFQVKGRYIVCPVRSGLMVIDQRRAHERILFEEYLKSLETGFTGGQRTVFNEEVVLEASDYYLFKEIAESLTASGFEFEDLGSYRILVKSYPASVINAHAGDFFISMIESYKSQLSDVHGEIKERVAAAMAAGAAIPYGRILLTEEMEQLIDRLFACKSPNYSPAGRPVVSIITMDEIDKRFK
ncbi:MAG TPA: DNA mismatch repair endonuclease MutL [Bacteroidales bacterium]|nr:DNA mismatch repair endonuclease MutL [Bacteroidales bacterium]HRT89227.1 DNA mismatch repair endonuclease MutL [Bacteroidales bacterium]